MVSKETLDERLKYLEQKAAERSVQKVNENKQNNPNIKKEQTLQKKNKENLQIISKNNNISHKQNIKISHEQYTQNLEKKLKSSKKLFQSFNQIELKQCIGPAFYDMHCDIREGKHTYYNLAGGRGSLKSSSVSIEIVLGMMNDRDANAVVYRKVGDTLATSVYEQVVWAVDILGANDDWKCTKSPMVCEYKPFKTRILFKGLDKAKKSKSLKFSRGYAKYLWFEEFDEFTGPEEIRSVQQSVLRGGDQFFVFKSMNPPKSKSNWANDYMETESLREDTYTSHTTYLEAPQEWLGQQFIDDAEWLKETKPTAYEHEYLGKAVGTGADVFDNIVSKHLTDLEISQFANIYMGVDWGWFPDPFRWVKMNYDANRRVLSIFDELSCNKKTNQQTFNMLRDEKGVTAGDLITCDSAERKSVGDFKIWGFMARPAEKGPGSIESGIKWLQSLEAIVIDPIRCPHTYDEFYHYELELDNEGNPIDGAFPDANNHSIDATRYAMERVSKRRGN